MRCGFIVDMRTVLETLHKSHSWVEKMYNVLHDWWDISRSNALKGVQTLWLDVMTAILLSSQSAFQQQLAYSWEMLPKRHMLLCYTTRFSKGLSSDSLEKTHCYTRNWRWTVSKMSLVFVLLHFALFQKHKGNSPFATKKCVNWIMHNTYNLVEKTVTCLLQTWLEFRNLESLTEGYSITEEVQVWVWSMCQK